MNCGRVFRFRRGKRKICARRGVRANYLRADKRRAPNKITASFFAFLIDVPRAGSNPSLMIRRTIKGAFTRATPSPSLPARPTAVVAGVLSKVTANNNSIDGIIVDIGVTTAASLNVTVVDSVAANNSGNVVEASGGPGLVVMLRNIVARNNGTGLAVDAIAILLVAHSVVMRNGTGVTTSGGTITYGDNDINYNTIDNFSALTTIAMH
ncbi:MAG: hypothetical protein CR217_14250 [Beijerinckiaceae bacterium]|nr:MAG: hypothetical protein CR217_14250 [Beijerinckiaceae bacterium]